MPCGMNRIAAISTAPVVALPASARSACGEARTAAPVIADGADRRARPSGACRRARSSSITVSGTVIENTSPVVTYEMNSACMPPASAGQRTRDAPARPACSDRSARPSPRRRPRRRGSRTGPTPKREHCTAVGDQQRRHRAGQREQVERCPAASAPMCGTGTALSVDAGPAVDRRVERRWWPSTKVTASVSSANSSPRTERTRNTTAPSATPSTRGHRGSHRQRGQERPIELAASTRGGVDAGAEERAVAEREVARVARQDVPRGGQHAPSAAPGTGSTRRTPAGRSSGTQAERSAAPPRMATMTSRRFIDAAPGSRPPGRSNSSAISSVNDTIGAHDGAVTAIVNASLTPITTPATSGPQRAARGRPSSPRAKTTPIQA